MEATLSYVRALPTYGWSELRFTTRVSVKYTLDFEVLEEKYKIQNISLITLNIAYMLK